MGDPVTDALMMTHPALQQNTAKPILDAYKGFMSGGLYGAGFNPFGSAGDQIASVLQSDAANTAMGMTTPMKGMKGITAYHGSPHDFDKFDISKIGTGERANMYGRGLYFAENENTARSYKEQLTHGKTGTVTIGGKEIPTAELTSAQSLAAGAVHWPGDPIENLSKLKTGNLYTPEVIEEAKKLIKSGGVGYRPAGRMYQVSINADPEHFLDWDKPLSEQSEHVQEAIKKTPFSDYLKTSFKGSQLAPYTQEGMEKLRQAGISGIKYLDQGSRAAGEGSRNYVVFDDKMIDILKKFAITAGIPTAGLLSSRGNTNGNQ